MIGDAGTVGALFGAACCLGVPDSDVPDDVRDEEPDVLLVFDAVESRRVICLRRDALFRGFMVSLSAVVWSVVQVVVVTPGVAVVPRPSVSDPLYEPDALELREELRRRPAGFLPRPDVNSRHASSDTEEPLDDSRRRLDRDFVKCFALADTAGARSCFFEPVLPLDRLEGLNGTWLEGESALAVEPLSDSSDALCSTRRRIRRC